MLKRFYITIGLWFVAICALGLFARGSQDGLAMVLVGILPIGLVFILLLLFYVPPKAAVPTFDHDGSGFIDPASNASERQMVDWEGQAVTYPVEPHRQCKTIQLKPSQPILRLVHPDNSND